MTTETPVQDTATETPAPIAQAANETTAQALGSDGKPFDPERAKELIEKLREENKAAKASAKKLAEYEAAEQKRKDAELSEVERLTKQLNEVQEQAKAAARREMQRMAADKYKLPAEFAPRLFGETVEELEADAAKVAAALPKQATINPTNLSNGPVKATDAQWREFIFGNGSLPGV